MTDPEIRAAVYRELTGALDTLNRVPEQLRQGDVAAANLLLDDVRAHLGAIALLCSDEPDAAGYAELLKRTLTGPTSAAEAAFIERHGHAS
ncbi:hypothetical protein SK224_00275 [Microbacterium sp. BG28]|uniref:hypothetical protein n=1 Tax=Microbacterium sp. BG28 TaxID=3097356 RepID=UPI002A5AC9C7|nr:hypothetical protein [Microbacterium sp. BG28]MDY0827555.1 hypothetical protein [Microbacterium sp. BG28]